MLNDLLSFYEIQSGNKKAQNERCPKSITIFNGRSPNNKTAVLYITFKVCKAVIYQKTACFIANIFKENADFIA